MEGAGEEGREVERGREGGGAGGRGGRGGGREGGRERERERGREGTSCGGAGITRGVEWPERGVAGPREAWSASMSSAYLL